jgi:hypothetical protein
MKVLTKKEHDRYVHLCGLTGKQLERQHDPCLDCLVILDCFRDHAIKSIDAEPRKKLEEVET